MYLKSTYEQIKDFEIWYRKQERKIRPRYYLYLITRKLNKILK